MTDVTNSDRAAWAATAIEAFTAECRMDGEDKETKAKDLACNLVHFLRLECGLSLDDAVSVIRRATDLAYVEAVDDEDDDSSKDDEPVEREYGVRLWATFRGECDTRVKAFSFEEAVAKAKLLDHNDFNYSIDDSIEGDESMQVFGPNDDDPDNEDEWSGDGVEVDKRKPGEPFSWDAVQLVKDLAAFKDKGWGSADIVPLINRAAAHCTKEKDDDADTPAS